MEAKWSAIIKQFSKIYPQIYNHLNLFIIIISIFWTTKTQQFKHFFVLSQQDKKLISQKLRPVNCKNESDFQDCWDHFTDESKAIIIVN